MSLRAKRSNLGDRRRGTICQVSTTQVLERLGVPKERMVTLMIEPDYWLTKACQDSRRLVIAAGLSDDDIDRLIKRDQEEVEPRARWGGSSTPTSSSAPPSRRPRYRSSLPAGQGHVR